jgi:hypothetical protein
LRQQGVEGAEGMVDALRVLEAAGFLSQRNQEILGFVGLRGSVPRAEREGIPTPLFSTKEAAKH